MSYERCFGGFVGHNVDRRLWVDSCPSPAVRSGKKVVLEPAIRFTPWRKMRFRSHTG